MKRIGGVNLTRRESLNVHNSNRMFNCHLTTKEKEKDFTKVTTINQKEVEGKLRKLQKESLMYNKRDNEKYLIYKQRYGNDTLNDLIMNHGGYVYYYTDDKVPLPIINQLAKTPQSEVIFRCQKEYNKELVQNVHLTSMATKVTMDVPIVLPDINPYDYLFALYPLRYHVDKVKMSFPTLTEGELEDRHRKYYEKHHSGEYRMKPKYKYKCFQHLYEPFSTWKMNLWLICDSTEDMRKLEDKVSRDNKRYKRVTKPITQKKGDK